jgi:cytochrome c556
MDAKRSGEPLTDVERELAAALAVEPSADFLARVRMRIAAEEAAPALLPASWMLAAAGVGTTAIAIAVVFTQMSVTAVPPSPRPTRSVVAAGQPSIEKPTPEMQSVMNANADTNTASKAHLDDKDYEALIEDAAAYEKNFSYIDTFWAAKRVEGARAISKRGLKAAGDLRLAAMAKDDMAVAAAIAIIFGTCEACHKTYRERLTDNTFAIKL